MGKVIAVFGSARVMPESQEYQDAYLVGQTLAQAGFTVSTGGYAGVMEGASRGAAEAGGHVIGVTTAEAVSFESEVNPYVDQVIEYPTLRERLHHLVDHSDGYIVMSGGIGTLQELAETWQILRMNNLPPRPFVCYGQFWEPLVAHINASAYVGERDIRLIQVMHNAQILSDHLIQWFKEKA